MTTYFLSCEYILLEINAFKTVLGKKYTDLNYVTLVKNVPILVTVI